VNIQAVSAYTSQLGIAGGASQGASMTELAQQHGVSPDSLDQLVDRSLDHDHESGTGNDRPATDGTPFVGYTADAQRTAGRVGASGTISILA
jgi:transposase-like protein